MLPLSLWVSAHGPGAALRSNPGQLPASSATGTWGWAPSGKLLRTSHCEGATPHHESDLCCHLGSTNGAEWNAGAHVETVHCGCGSAKLPKTALRGARTSFCSYEPRPKPKSSPGSSVMSASVRFPTQTPKVSSMRIGGFFPDAPHPAFLSWTTCLKSCLGQLF